LEDTRFTIDSRGVTTGVANAASHSAATSPVRAI